MPPKKRASNVELSRLKVLAAGDERAFLEYAPELLRRATGWRARRRWRRWSSGRCRREALRALRALYFELAADGLKRDQGATMRVAIVQILQAIGDVRDRDIAVDAHGHVGDRVRRRPRVAAARARAAAARRAGPGGVSVYRRRASRRLAGRCGGAGEHGTSAAGRHAATTLALYQWLISGDQAAGHVPACSSCSPRGRARSSSATSRAIEERAARSEDDELAIGAGRDDREARAGGRLRGAGELMSAKISEELYNYLAVLLAGTNRPALLAILEEQLRRGRRPKVVATALQVRSDVGVRRRSSSDGKTARSRKRTTVQ